MTKSRDMALVPIERINNLIHLVRGQRVIIDRELAAIYGVETRTFNQAIKRNAGRFPEDFMFQLTREEAMASRSQTVILKRGRGQNIKFLPYAFTEHGAIQAANVLNSPRAVMMGIHVVRAFVQLRDLLASNKELAHKFAELERKLATHDQAITGILRARIADIQQQALDP
jgi:ORF6N domain